MSNCEKTQHTLSTELDVTKSQLISVQHELNTVRQNCSQQTDLLSRASTTLTLLADQMNTLVSDKADDEQQAVSL